MNLRMKLGRIKENRTKNPILQSTQKGRKSRYALLEKKGSIPLLKEGKNPHPANSYRPISLLSVIGKL